MVSVFFRRLLWVGMMASPLGTALTVVTSVQQVALAQVSADNSLSTTVTTTDNLNFVIEAGDRAGNNLFHSFDEFSIPVNGSAVFNNATDIETVFSRVTGNQSSTLDGLLQSAGNADLFLINPNGIVFGENAQLNIGGSLITSTADSIHFADGTEFSATSPSNSLLTISTPIGLQLGQNPGPIEVNGIGKDGTVPTANLGLTPPSGTTIAFVGESVSFRGGVVTAESGRIEVGSGSNGLVELTPIAAGWALDYTDVEDFGSVRFSRRSSLWNPNVTANSTGGIQVVGQDIRLNRSQIAAATQGDRTGGDITVSAQGTVILAGEDLTQFPYSSWIVNQVDANASGDSGAIAITADTLRIRDGARIQTLSAGSGHAGAIDIDARQLNINGFSSLSSNSLLALLNLNSRIASDVRSTGSAGTINVRAEQINLRSGGQIISTVEPNASGNGGDISVDAAHSIQIIGQNLASSLFLSAIANYSLGLGDTGRMDVSTPFLKLENGGSVVNLNLNSGRGNDIHVNVSEQIIARGRSLDDNVASGIGSATAGGAPGSNLFINTGIFRIEDGANVGTVTVLQFPGAGELTAEQRSASAGDINVTATERINVSGVPETRLNGFSGLGSNTSLPGSSGSLTITTPTLLIQDGGNVGTTVSLPTLIELTDAEKEIVGQGDGGDVQITAHYVEVSGTGETSNLRSALGNLTGGDGNSGNTYLEVGELVVEDGGTVFSSTFASGEAGTLAIDASESITVSQSQNENNEIAGIAANALRLNDPELAEIFSLPEKPTGNTGAVRITTPLLRLTDEGRISVQHQGTGNAGRLEIQAGQILLTDDSQITAETSGGNGGDITVRLVESYGPQSQSLLILENEGLISAESRGRGNSGDINIASLFILGADNSDIVANAELGNGGNINITTQGLFGLQFRDRLTPANDITASSEFGLDGTVDINGFNTELNSVLVELPSEFADARDQIVQGCDLRKNRFIVTGRGGLPTEPDSDRPWLQLLPDFGLIPDEQSALSAPLMAWDRPTPLPPHQPADVTPPSTNGFREATEMAIAPDGSLQLVTGHAYATMIAHPSCSSPPNIL